MEEAGSFLLALGSNPWAIACAIVLATFILEDVAIIAAALLAADKMIAPELALSALIVGIFVGDLGLFGLGAAARTRDWAKRVIGEKRMAKGRAWLKRRYIPALIGARFTPGLRLATYTASGFLKLPFWPFAGVAAAAGLAWTSLIFGLAYVLGPMIAERLGSWRWVLAAGLLTLALFGPWLSERLAPKPANGEGS